MAKTKQPTKTAIKKALNDAAFDPRLPGPLKVIADMDNVFYYTNRATEILRTGEQGGPSEMREALTQAMSLLALARVKLN